MASNWVFAGVIALNLSPVLIALGTYRLAQRARHPWIVHLLLIPSLLASHVALIALCLALARPDAIEKSSPSLDDRVLILAGGIPATMTGLIATICYYVAAGLEKFVNRLPKT
jgi:hypothetical protein